MMAEPNHGSFEPRGQSVVRKDRNAEGRFGLMFKHLKPFSAPSPDLLRQLAETMRQAPTGVFDNSDIAAGFTFFGQFVDHDLTADLASDLEKQQDPDGLTTSGPRSSTSTPSTAAARRHAPSCTTDPS
jgi:hypothetical protein